MNDVDNFINYCKNNFSFDDIQIYPHSISWWNAWCEARLNAEKISNKFINWDFYRNQDLILPKNSNFIIDRDSKYYKEYNKDSNFKLNWLGSSYENQDIYKKTSQLRLHFINNSRLQYLSKMIESNWQIEKPGSWWKHKEDKMFNLSWWPEWELKNYPDFYIDLFGKATVEALIVKDVKVFDILLEPFRNVL